MEYVMSEKHAGIIRLVSEFDLAWEWIRNHPNYLFATNSGTLFTARAGNATKGINKGMKVIRIYQDKVEYSRAYECCWGHYSNCNRTLLGMYSQAIDKAINDTD